MAKKIILFFTIMMMLGSCKKTLPNASNPEERFFLVSHAGAGDPFWNIVFTGAKQAAADIDMNLQILSPEMPNDIARQVELLNAAIASKPKGIALTIPDAQAFSASLRQAKLQGIPIMAFNTRPAGTKKENPYLAFVGMDDYQAGLTIAKKSFTTGKIKARAMVAIHQAGHVGLEQRALGIKDALSPENIVVDKLDISSDATQAQQLVQGYLSNNTDCSAVFFVGSFGLHALGRWLKEEHPNVMMSSFDLSPLTLKLIEDGTVAFVADQQPFMQGYMTMAQLSLNARYSLYPTDMNTGVSLIDAKRAVGLDKLVSLGVR